MIVFFRNAFIINQKNYLKLIIKLLVISFKQGKAKGTKNVLQILQDIFVF